MTRDYRQRQGLSGTDELLHRMILDNTHVTRETRDMVMRQGAQTVELRHDLMHLSQQVVGLTYRLWQQEARMANGSSHPPREEGMRWVFRQAWELFTGPQKVSMLVLLLMVVLGLSEPKDVQTWLRGLVGLPPIVSTQQYGSQQPLSPGLPPSKS